MKNKRHSSKEIRDFIIKNVDKDPQGISRLVSEKFKISRQAINRYLLKMVKDNLLISKGNTRSKRYYLKPIIEKKFNLEIISNLEEDVVWRQKIKPLFINIKPNIVNILHYGFTEMFNNVIDHSGGKNVAIGCKYFLNKIEINIFDDGIGIFSKIKNELGLEDHLHAILELSKGKLTTDPERHTGEGIFFTSRTCDKFSILSGKLFYSHFSDDDWLLEDKSDNIKGTLIGMTINTETERTLKEVLDKYTSEGEDYGFSKTRVPVSLTTYGEERLVSRSQARRLLARFERFKEVILDFKGINFIGQAFADEIFRVYKNENPNVKIIWIRVNKDVENMIKKVLNHKK